MYGPLLRPRYDRRIAGVCAAFARSYGWDLTMVRVVIALLVIFAGGGILAYLICWIVIPEEPLNASYWQSYATGYPPQPPRGYPPPPSYPPQAQQSHAPYTPPTEPPAVS